jgi:diadenosine tetraphosphate (Ap4A) HIT family hydrolase
VVNHTHFHIIPKPSDSDEEGLVIGWPSKELSKDELEILHKEVTGKL